jgi:hypothetical protein
MSCHHPYARTLSVVVKTEKRREKSCCEPTTKKITIDPVKKVSRNAALAIAVTPIHPSIHPQEREPAEKETGGK